LQIKVELTRNVLSFFDPEVDDVMASLGDDFGDAERSDVLGGLERGESDAITFGGRGSKSRNGFPDVTLRRCCCWW
jgi:hypothetical protein